MAVLGAIPPKKYPIKDSIQAKAAQRVRKPISRNNERTQATRAVMRAAARIAPWLWRGMNAITIEPTSGANVISVRSGRPVMFTALPYLAAITR